MIGSCHKPKDRTICLRWTPFSNLKEELIKLLELTIDPEQTVELVSPRRVERATQSTCDSSGINRIGIKGDVMSESRKIDPKDTHAIVVGIEKYDGGWELDGPATDACKFVDWLRARHVPADNITLFLSPLDQNLGVLNRPQPQPKGAFSHQIYQEITENLARKNGELLIVNWGGHAVIKADGTRRLFYADANQANMVNFDLNSALIALRSEYFQGFKSQIFIVDACAEYFELGGVDVSLPHQTLPAGYPAEGCDQFVLLASRPGELAENLTTRKTGRFSEAVRQLLGKQDNATWPPEMQRLTTDLLQRFTELRDAGEVYQTPSFFWYRDWNDNEGTLGNAHIQGRAVLASSRRGLTAIDKRRLTQALLLCPSMKNFNTREAVLMQLRSRIYNSIPRNATAQIEVFNVVDTCLNYVGGMLELMEAVRVFDGETNAVQNLDNVIQKVMSEELS